MGKREIYDEWEKAKKEGKFLNKDVEKINRLKKEILKKKDKLSKEGLLSMVHQIIELMEEQLHNYGLREIIISKKMLSIDDYEDDDTNEWEEYVLNKIILSNSEKTEKDM